MTKRSMWLGLDFGTVWSKAAIFDPKKDKFPELVNLAGKSSIAKQDYVLGGHKFEIPTAILIERDSGKFLIGHDAVNRRLSDPASFFDRFKLKIGLEEPVFTEHIQQPIYWVDLVTAILGHLKESAEEQANEKIFNGVITVPALYHEDGPEWKVMMEAAKRIGLSEVRIIREPEAAAIYANYITSKDSPPDVDDVYLIYDLGGGTFDPAVIRFRGDSFEVIGGYNSREGIRAGGIFIDRLLLADFKAKTPALDEYLSSIPRDEYGNIKHGHEEKSLQVLRDMRLALEFAVGVKHYFGDNEKSNSFSRLNNITFDNYELSRLDFHSLIERMLDKTIDACNALLSKCSLSWDKLRKVIVVGGTTKLPFVRDKLIENLDRHDATNVELIWNSKKYSPVSTIALGAAVYRSQLPSPEKLIDLGIQRWLGGRIHEAEYCFRKSVEEGGKTGALYLGFIEYYGLNTKKSYKNALRWFEKAVQDCVPINANALTLMALMYFKGEGVRKSDSYAKEILVKLEDADESTMLEVIINGKRENINFPKVQEQLSIALGIEYNHNGMSEIFDNLYTKQLHEI